jgi:hypothetical protein
MVSKALKLAEQGFKVFPLSPNSKRNWWSQWPKANIAIVPGPEYFVFDIDVRTPGHKESLAKLKALGLKSTLTVKTQGGGYHLYYKHPGGGVIKAADAQWKKDYPGIDIRADGAYVVAPGSIINNKEYRWVS